MTPKSEGLLAKLDPIQRCVHTDRSLSERMGMPESSKLKTVKVCVFLGHGFGATSWRRRHALQLIPGLNDRLPYGYYRAACDGWSIEYSEDRQEDWLTRFTRLALRKLLGFDAVHVLRNRQRILRADFVWTHTELEHLGVLALLKLAGRDQRPKLIANCVWLFDRWPRLSRARRAFYRWLLQQATVITTFSPENLKVAQRLLPSVRCEFIPWGALSGKMTPPQRRGIHEPIRIASLGNDMHRDWETLLEAFANLSKYEVRIASTKINRRLASNLRNVEIIAPETAAAVQSLYDWSDIVVVPLKPNLHASGLTVLFESVISGVPSVCTDTGGLRAYFSDREVAYVPSFAPLAMRAAAEELSKHHTQRFMMVNKAQEHLLAADLTAQGFALRNRRLSEGLLDKTAGAQINSRPDIGFGNPAGLSDGTT
jgi:glycosyltransferase involved in cell wall biosynthesis